MMITMLITVQEDFKFKIMPQYMYVCILANLYCTISIAKTRELNSVIALPTKLVQKFLNESECAAQF